MITPSVPWAEWEPVYEAILADFGFERRADEMARDELVELLDGVWFDPSDLPDATGLSVAVAGPAPGLEAGLDLARAADLVIGVSAASDLLHLAGISVDLHVTDLDESRTILESLAADGVPMAVHAHGDNRNVIARRVPDLNAASILPTTQAEPRAGIYNFGGFTDGDRAAFLADTMGATELVFPGWEFEDDTVSPTKRRKLGWAERLLYWLELRRGDRFSILDGRRDAIDMAAFPNP